MGLRVVGVSPQDAESHTNFKDEHNLPFTLICDPDKIAIKMYDVDGPFGVGVRRVTYLVTQGQKIQDVLTADIKIDKHKEFIQRTIVVLRESAGMKVETPGRVTRPESIRRTDRQQNLSLVWPRTDVPRDRFPARCQAHTGHSIPERLNQFG